jgi:hypothetical protein
MFSRPRALPAGFIAPCLPTNAPQPPSGELLYDGFGVIACKDKDRWGLVRQQVLWEHWGGGDPPTQDVLRALISGHGLVGRSSGVLKQHREVRV